MIQPTEYTIPYQVADTMLVAEGNWEKEAKFCRAVSQFIKAVDKRGIPGTNYLFNKHLWNMVDRLL